MLAWTVFDGVELRLPEEYMAAEFFQVLERNRDRLGTWLSWVHDTTSPQDVARSIRDELRAGLADSSAINLFIFGRGSIIGGIGMKVVEPRARVAELGYWLDGDWEGRRIVTIASRKIIDYGFTAWNLGRLQIRCSPGNTRSNAIPKRLGFTYEGTLRRVNLVGGRLLDLEYYSLLRDEWLADGSAGKG